jgi:hypothetical protein
MIASEIRQWQQAERQCEHIPLKISGNVRIRKIIKILNQHPPIYKQYHGAWNTSCIVAARTPPSADCDGLSSWAYYMIRKHHLAPDNKITMILVTNKQLQAANTRHMYLKVGGWAIDYWPKYWPKPFYYRPALYHKTRHGFKILARFNLFTSEVLK